MGTPAKNLSKHDVVVLGQVWRYNSVKILDSINFLLEGQYFFWGGGGGG